jgi:RNA polymerase sigma-70 factor (ECF subfamily)
MRHSFAQLRQNPPAVTLFRKQPATDFMEATHDCDTWKSWLEAHGPKLLLCARQWTRSLADAEDVVQEAFVRYWRHQRHLPGDPQALLITSIRRAALDHARRQARRAAREEKADGGLEEREVSFEPQPGDDAERRQEIEAALERLPVVQREVLVLKIWNELTFEQIGETLEIPANTAASRYRYALAALRKELKPARHG